MKSLLAPGADDAGPAQPRADVRSNLFVAAMLHSDGGAVPVRIRNLSRGGALIETALVPPEGTQVQLVRGRHGVSGRIAWRCDKRGGIRFESDITVGDWLPGGNCPTGQQRVDAIVHACRTGGQAPGSAPRAPALAQPEVAGAVLKIGDALNAAAELLAADPAVAAAHPTTLQTIDVLGQDLRKLAARLLLDDGR